MLIADLRFTWSDKQPEPLWVAVAEILSSQLYFILRDEVRKADLATVVLRQPLVLEEDPYAHSPLYVRIRMELKAVPDAQRTVGLVGVRFERLGFETVHFAQPATTFFAANDDLLSRSTDAVRTQLAAFAAVLAAHEARRPTF